MKIKLFVAMLALCALCTVAAAQSYSIRVSFNTNLRASASLQAHIVESAPAGTTLQVVGESNRWLKINSNGNVLWMASWVRHSRVDDSSETSAQIDNCCFVDRQCHTDQQWTDGYWAFQNGQCAVPTQTQPQPNTQASAQPVATAPTHINNCCFVDRQCHTDQQWTDGYYAFQKRQCAASAQTQPSMGPVAAVTEPLIVGLPPTTQINNCCNLDRECHTEEEWTAGWLAFKNNECGYELVNYTPPGSQPLLGIDNCCHAPGWFCQSDENFRQGHMAYNANNHCPTHLIQRFMYYDLHPITDNCCDLGRECHTDADWQRGYSDFLHFRCEIDIPLVTNLPISIEGNQDFVASWIAAFSLLNAQSPRFYEYAITGLNAIKEYSDGDPNRAGCVVDCGSEKTAYCEWDHYFTYIDHKSIAVTASVIVHEACHCHRDAKGYPHGNNEWEVELPCIKAQADLMKDLDPGNSFGIPWEDYRESARKHNVTDLRY